MGRTSFQVDTRLPDSDRLDLLLLCQKFSERLRRRRCDVIGKRVEIIATESCSGESSAQEGGQFFSQSNRRSCFMRPSDTVFSALAVLATCTVALLDQCPHRMACAKCWFYLPKESAKAQALEAGANITLLLQEISLQDTERAAVEDGIEAMEKLVDSLSHTITPDGRAPNAVKKS